MGLMKLLCGFFSGACGYKPPASSPDTKTTAGSAATDVQPNTAGRAQTAPPAPPESEEIATPS